MSPQLFAWFTLLLTIVNVSQSQTPSPTTAPVVACFDIASDYCPTGTGCFAPDPDREPAIHSKTCAQCDYPNTPTKNPNTLGICSNANVSKTCQEAYPNDCACITGVSQTTTPFKANRTFKVYNECPYPVWAAMIGKDWATGDYEPSMIPYDGGFKLESKTMVDLSVPVMQSMLLWPRTNCGDVDGTFECDTGACGNKGNLLGKGGKCCNTKNGTYSCGTPKSPTSKIEFTLAKDYCGGNDFYDASLVDGYSIPILVKPCNYSLNDTIDAEKLGSFACGRVEINPFDSKTNCPDVMQFNGTQNRNSTDIDFAEFTYCLSICQALIKQTHRNKFALLKTWNVSNASIILKEFYSESQLSKRFISGQSLVDLLCCRCGANTETDSGCYDSTECNFGCSPFIDGGWNSSTLPDAWHGSAIDYYKRECPNYGYTTNGAINAQMPMWPLLDANDIQINPAYIYNQTSPDAYSWQYDDEWGTFQCRNADYTIVFCHDQADNLGDICPSGSTTMPPLTTIVQTNTTMDHEDGDCRNAWIWVFVVAAINVFVDI